jgi:hypothetical protein
MVNATNEIDLGYVFYPPREPHDPGHPRLDIFLRPEPTYQHFDPEKVYFNVVPPNEEVQELVISYPWVRQKKYQVYPGRIFMIDRLRTTKEVFTFGADLEIDNNEERTQCIITSPAPILGLIIPHSIAVMLAEEVEILLAELRAVWAEDLGELEKRLASAGPLSLYGACLDALSKKFEAWENQEDELAREFIHFLHVECQSLHDIHHAFSESLQLGDLFSPLMAEFTSKQSPDGEDSPQD